MGRVIVLSTSGKDEPAPKQGEGEAVPEPVHTTAWNHFTDENGRLLCGIWESRPGFTGTWDTVETVRKHHVILLPEPGKS